MNAAYRHDPDGHATGITYSSSGTQLGNLTYTYDADGRVTSKDGTMASTGMPAPVSGNTFNAANQMTPNPEPKIIRVDSTI